MVGEVLKFGKPAKLYTHLNVREDAMELFGFSTENELNCFQLLTSVSGVGPKAALSILSAATPESLAMSIITGDEKALTVAQGIGKKIAQRIILELKGSFDEGLASLFDGTAPAAASAANLAGTREALLSMGFTSEEADVALKGAPEGASEGVLLQYALKRLGSAGLPTGGTA